MSTILSFNALKALKILKLLQNSVEITSAISDIYNKYQYIIIIFIECFVAIFMSEHVLSSRGSGHSSRDPVQLCLVIVCPTKRKGKKRPKFLVRIPL